MSWITYALLTHFFWSLTNIGEKFLVDKKFKNPYVYAVVAIFAGTVGLFIIPFVDFFVPSFEVLAWIFFGALSFFVGILFYVKAIQIEEISRINVFWSFIPLFSLFGGWIFIGEHLSFIQIFSFIFLFLGGFVSSLHAKSFGRFSLSPAFALMSFACVFFASYNIIIRYVSLNFVIPFSIVFVFITASLLIVSLFSFFSRKFRDDFKKESKNFLTLKILFVVIFINILSKVGLFFNIKAISLGPIALVNSLEGSQTIMVFIMTILLTIFFPKIVKEEIDKKNVLLKIGAILLMVVGVVVLSMN